MANKYRANKGRIGSHKAKWARYEETLSNTSDLVKWLWSVGIDQADNVTSHGGVIRWDDARGQEVELTPGQYLVFSAGRFQSLAAEAFTSQVRVAA